MNLHPNIANTVANWALNGTLADSSGNGLDLTLENGPSAYLTFGAFTGFSFDVAANLLAPFNSRLILGGDLTVEWLHVPRTTLCNCFFGSTSPTHPIAGDKSGGTAAAYYSIFNTPQFIDQQPAGNFPALLLPNSPIPAPEVGNTNPLIGIAINDVINHYAFRREGRVWTCFINGVSSGPSGIRAVQVPWGDERFRIGAITQLAQMGGCPGYSWAVMGSMRVLDVARPDIDIQRDAFYTLGPAASTDTGIVYDAVAAAQFATALRQEPRR